MKETPEATLQVSYVRAVLRLRLSFLAKQAPPDDTLANLVATRKAVDDEGAASLFDVFQLSATEKQIAWILFAVAVDSECCSIVAQLYGEPTLEFLRALVHGDSASSEGLADTCADSALRRFGIVERADGGNALVHETKQTWVISSRIVRWALGDHRIAPTLSKVLRVSAGPTTTMGLIAAEPTLLSMLIFGLILAAAGLITLAAVSRSAILIGVVIMLCVIAALMLALVQAALQGIYAAAVYRYAEEGVVGGGFDNALVANAFKQK